MLKASDLREETQEELQKRVSEMEDQLMRLRFQKATGQLDDVHKIRNVRKDLARVKTAINEHRRQKAREDR